VCCIPREEESLDVIYDLLRREDMLAIRVQKKVQEVTRHPTIGHTFGAVGAPRSDEARHRTV
jgi:hypothetical protein